MRSVTILAGCGKDGRPEPFDTISLERGELYTIVGNTGSGKSRFIKDIEQLALKLTVKATLMLERLVKRMALAARSFPPSPAAYAGIHAPVLDFPSYCKVSGSQIPGLEGA